MRRLSARGTSSFAPQVECVEQRFLLSASLLAALPQLTLNAPLALVVPETLAVVHTTTNHPSAPPTGAKTLGASAILAVKLVSVENSHSESPASAAAHSVVVHVAAKEPVAPKASESAKARALVHAPDQKVGPTLQATGAHPAISGGVRLIGKHPVEKVERHVSQSETDSVSKVGHAHTVSHTPGRGSGSGLGGHGGSGGGGKARVVAAGGSNGHGAGRGIVGHSGLPAAIQVAWQGVDDLPLVADSLVEATTDFLTALMPVNPDLVSQAVQHFLAELDALRLALQKWLADRADALVWVLAVAAVMSAGEMTRRRWQQQRNLSRAASEVGYLAGLLPELPLPQGV